MSPINLGLVFIAIIWRQNWLELTGDVRMSPVSLGLIFIAIV